MAYLLKTARIFIKPTINDFSMEKSMKSKWFISALEISVGIVAITLFVLVIFAGCFILLNQHISAKAIGEVIGETIKSAIVVLTNQ